jgi:exodeoxyribonuclease-3
VNGIRAAHKKGFLDWLQAEAPDILCIQETKAHPDQVPRKVVNPPHYYSFWNSATHKKGYSGVAVYSKAQPKRVNTDMGMSELDREGRFLELEYDDLLLFNVYFPNGKKDQERLDYKMKFYEAFLTYVEECRARTPRIIFCGDVNTAHNEIDLARPKENEQSSGFLRIERDWIDRVVARGYHDTFRRLHPDKVEYSWWDQKTRARERNVGWRIDYVFVTGELLPNVRNAFIRTDVMGSDHCPVGVDLHGADHVSG